MIKYEKERGGEIERQIRSEKVFGYINHKRERQKANRKKN